MVPQEEAGSRPGSFDRHAGETLALVGLRGAGHHAIGRAIFGAMPAARGNPLDGHADRPGNPGGGDAAGIGFVSSRRGEESLAAR